MSARWRVLALMTFAQAGASVVQQALGSLSPALVETYGLTKAQLGVVFTAMMLGSMLFTALAGALTDRWGERRMVLVAGALMACALAAAAAWPAYPWLIACMSLFGVGYAASTPAGGRAILAWFKHDRAFAMGIRQTGVPIGGLVGALTLPLVAAHVGYRAAFVYAALLVAVPTLCAFFGYRGAKDDAPSSLTFAAVGRGMRELVREPRVLALMATCMVLVGSQVAMNAFVAITAVNVVGTSAFVGALALACGQAAAGIGRLVWGYLSDRIFHGERLVPFAIIAVLAAVAAAALGLLGRGAVGVLLLATALLGFSGAGWNGLFSAALAEIGGADRAASAIGIGLTGIFLASAISPSAFGLLADHTTLHVAWAVVAGLALLGVFPVLWLRTHVARAKPTMR
jgi:ACS family hexuronate transporter-like MFS transporter